MNKAVSKVFAGVKGVLIGIGVLIVIVISFLLNTSVTPDPTSTPSCNVNAAQMVQLINQYRTKHYITPYTETSALDRVAQDLSNIDAKDSTLNFSVAQITQAANDEAYTNHRNLTYQVFPSIDSTQNNDIFKEMTAVDAYKTGLLDPSYTKVGVYINCSTSTRTVTVHSDSSSQASINGQQYKVYSLVYITYDK